MSISKLQPSVNGVALTLAPCCSSEFDITWYNEDPSNVDPNGIRRWLKPLKKKLPDWVAVKVWIVEKRCNYNQSTGRYDYGYPDVRYNIYVYDHIRPQGVEFDIEQFMSDFAEVARLHGVKELRLYLKEHRGWKL